MEDQTINITILNWSDYNPRKDVKNPTWFRLEHDMIEAEEYFDFTHEEFRLWIYILSRASKKNSDTIELSFERAHRVLRVSYESIRSVISKLEANQTVRVNAPKPRPSHVRDVHVTDTNAAVTPSCTTRRDETRRNETEQEDSESDENAAAAQGDLPPLAELWNEFSHPDLPKVRSMHSNSKRRTLCEARWNATPDPELWKAVIHRINASNFCRGENKRAWKADIDFLCTLDGPAKVLEGKYDNRPQGPPGGPPGGLWGGHQREDNADDQLRAIMGGALDLQAHDNAQVG